jgi:hypothetical protein
MDGCDLPPGLPPTLYKDGWMITFLPTFHLALGFNHLLNDGCITERTLRMIESTSIALFLTMNSLCQHVI